MRGMRSLVPAALLASAFCACSGNGLESFGAHLPDIQLVMPSSGEMGPSLASCPTEKCLTVVVAPWCPVCHSVTENIKAVRGYLKAAGVTSRVVVGLSPDSNALKQYAEEFGPDAQIDLARVLKPSGVPAFIVSDRGGKVLKTVAGFPGNAESSPALASALGLP